jgi:hypothetical protein
MCSHKFDKNQLQLVRQGNDQAVIVALDIKNHPAVLQDAGIAILRFDICGLLPGSFAGFFKPRSKWLLGLTVSGLLSKAFESRDGYDSHYVNYSPAAGLAPLVKTTDSLDKYCVSPLR